MAVALESVVKQLEDSGIVAPGKLKEFIPPQANPKDAQELMRELVRSQHLTKFQAQEIYQGRARSLLLGNYTILDKIGAGGMGQVFKAEHRRMKRVVAVKMLPKNVTKDAAAVARFQREVEAAAKLRHPNIVAADDADEAAGVHFLVMEYVEGSDLSALVKKNGPFPVAKAVNLILQAARGLEFAHKKGVIHRDIKPANLLLDNEGTVKILDMGLARIDSDDGPAQAELTGTGTVMGTVDYMAPEQALSTKTADARADIYSLGCSLYYLIAGKATYGGETLMAKLLAHRESPIPSLHDAQPDVSEQLVAVFKKMVAKKVDDRYQTMSAVVADLEASVAEAGGGQKSEVRSQTPSEDSGLMTFLKDIPAATIHKPTPTKKAKPASAPLAPVLRGEGPGVRGFGRNKPAILVGAAVLGVAILAGVIFKLQTKDGTLVVEINQPDAVVHVLNDKGEIEITQPGGGGKLTIAVDPGKHRLKVEKNGFQFFAQDFTVESGGEAAIHATLIPVKAATVAVHANQRWDTPAFQQWVKATQALPAEQQIEAVSKKLMELNPGFDGKVTNGSGNGPPTIKIGVVKEFAFSGIDVTDISPVRALKGLEVLSCAGSGPLRSKVSDLSPLQGLQLTKLFCSISEVSNLAPLNGMPLKLLYCQASRVEDLSPLQGMPLTDLNISNTLVTDLSPLKGMKLAFINCGALNITDISVLRGMPLSAVHGMAKGVSDLSPLADCKSLKLLILRQTQGQTKVTPAGVAALQKALPDCKIEWDAPAVPPSTSVASNPPLAVPLTATAPFDAVQAKAHQAAWAKHLGTQVETTNSVGAKMILIPPGEFLMGSTDEQVAQALKIAAGERRSQGVADRIQKAERPQHRVVLTQPFRMGATEVTRGQFKKFTAAAGYKTEGERTPLVDGQPQATFLAPGYPTTDDSPATCLTWNDAVAYCEWLSAQEKATCRLPTEAEWEYTCRAGTTTQFWFGDDPAALDANAWWQGRSMKDPQDVGLKPANPFGLFDVVGSAFEWCEDFWHEKAYESGPTENPGGPTLGERRVVRGGASNLIPTMCRSAYRHDRLPSYFDSATGFRVVHELRPTPPPIAKAPFDAVQAKVHQAAWAKHLGTQIETTNSVGAKMILIPPGEFLMGSNDGQVAEALKVAKGFEVDPSTISRIHNSERPLHRVVIARPFLFGATEVTVGEFKKFAAAAGYQTEAENAAESRTYLKTGQAETDESPAGCISWNDAVAFCQWLSVQEQVTYRLPTEAEWEYACRAGTTTQYFFGDDYQPLEKHGWYNMKGGGERYSVGAKLPNAFGLFDMHGSVWEACQDFYDEQWYGKTTPTDPTGPPSGSIRVQRGGAWNTSASHCRSAYRLATLPSYRYAFNLGFRVVREVTASAPPIAKAPFDAAQAKVHQESWARHLGTTVETTNSVGAKMVLIPPGEFRMGSTPDQIDAALKLATDAKMTAAALDRIRSEGPQHRVVLTKPFAMGGTEVTIGQYTQFVDATKYITKTEKLGGGIHKSTSDPKITWRSQTYQHIASSKPHSDSAVSQLTWEDCAAYCNWLSDQERLPRAYELQGDGVWRTQRNTGYRLPTEAEWEFACRAGTTTQYSFGDGLEQVDEFAWHSQNYAQNANAIVGRKRPNAFGLFDMHGHVSEWCSDFFDAQAYASSIGEDPLGATPSSKRSCRGGNTAEALFLHRCASRVSYSQDVRYHNMGFRVVRVLDVPTTTASGTPQSTIRTPQWSSPAFQQWMKDVAAMPAEKQVEAVAKKLVELNPGFDGKVTHKAVGGVVTDLSFVPDEVADLSPVRALAGLLRLSCLGTKTEGGRLTDLSPLEGMKLTILDVSLTPVSDLAPLVGLPLASLAFHHTAVRSLSPLRGMPLTTLNFNNTEVSDLAPLKGMPLKRLDAYGTLVADLTPLVECRTLEFVNLKNSKVTPAAVAALQKALPNCKLEWDDPAKATSPAKPVTNINDPAFQKWMKEVAAMPAEKQVEAVAKKLMELNPGFDGNVTSVDGKGPPKIANGVVTEIALVADNVTDISPIRALAALTSLNCSGSTGKQSLLSNLAPLQGMTLTYLRVNNTQVSDLTPLQGMPLTKLYCYFAKVTDLSPLQGMPLSTLDCRSSSVSDLSPLSSCKNLASLTVTNTQVTPAGVADLQRALPNCEIKWDDPAKPMSSVPTAPGTKP